MYSQDYETTSIMSLPDCKHIADTNSGFCPVDYFVPEFKEFYFEQKYYEKELKKAVDQDDEKNIKHFKKNISSIQNIRLQ